MEFSKEATLEATKELLRVVMLAVLPVTISAIETNKVDFRVIGIVAIVSALKFIDSLLHEANKELPKKEQNSGLLGKKGITF